MVKAVAVQYALTSDVTGDNKYVTSNLSEKKLDEQQPSVSANAQASCEFIGVISQL